MGGKRLAAVAVAGAVVLVATACMYDVAPLGPQMVGFGGTFVMNDRGVMAGMTTGAGGYPHAFVRFGDEPIQMIDGGSADASTVGDINENNVVVGTIGATRPGEVPSSGHPFRWTAETGRQDLPLPPGMVGAVGIDINLKGTILVAGYPDYWAERSQSFLWDPETSTYTALSRSEGYGGAYALNDQGVVVGRVAFRANEAEQAAYWDAETHTVHELDDGGATQSGVMDISNSGALVGSFYSPDKKAKIAYWPRVDGPPRLIDGYQALALNDHGLIAGYAQLPAEGSRTTAVLWDTAKEDTMFRLGDYGKGSSQATDVNNKGVAVGTAHDGYPPTKINAVHWDAYPKTAP